MTALDQYVRLESGGLWRADADAQRRDVAVSFGDATSGKTRANAQPSIPPMKTPAKRLRSPKTR